MTDKIVTDVWVAWKIEDGEVKFLGAFPTKERAQENADVVPQMGFQVSGVMLLGWGFHKDTGREYGNEPMPPFPTTRQ